MSISSTIAAGESRIVNRIMTLTRAAGEKGLIGKELSSKIMLKVGFYWLRNILPREVGYKEASRMIEESFGYLLNKES